MPNFNMANRKTNVVSKSREDEAAKEYTATTL